MRSNIRRRAAGVCAAVLFALANILCCQGVEELPPDAPCLDAAQSMAARTFDCTGDGDRANARYERFEREYRCKPVNVQSDPVTDYYHCSLAIGSMSCEQAEEAGDDLDAWFTVSAACAYIMRHADGTELPAPASAGGGS